MRKSQDPGVFFVTSTDTRFINASVASASSSLAIDSKDTSAMADAGGT